jgi:hypothetical protein
VQVVNGLTNSLKVERQHIPKEILAEADRLECLMFAGYDRISKAMSRQDSEENCARGAEHKRSQWQGQ